MNVSTDSCTITVVEKAYGGNVQEFLKTKNGKRMVDLAPQVGKALREFIGNRKGLVFATRTGKPLRQSNILRRQLHPLLEELELPKCGAHAFRRYRTTWLRKQRTPEGLVQYWLGHAGKSITDGYDRVREDVDYRKEVARAVSIGFTIPAIKSTVGQSGQRFQESAVHFKKLLQVFDSNLEEWRAQGDDLRTFLEQLVIGSWAFEPLGARLRLSPVGPSQRFDSGEL